MQMRFQHLCQHMDLRRQLPRDRPKQARRQAICCGLMKDTDEAAGLQIFPHQPSRELHDACNKERKRIGYDCRNQEEQH